MDILSANTPEKLKKAIEKFLQGDYSQEELVKAYNDAQKQAFGIRVIYDALPDVPISIDDPFDSLHSIWKWCEKADRTVDDILYSLGQQTIGKIINQFKKLRDFVPRVHSLVNSELQIKIQNETIAKIDKERKNLTEKKLKQMPGKIPSSSGKPLDILKDITSPLVLQAAVGSEMVIIRMRYEDEAVQSYLSKDPTFEDKLSQQSKVICEVVKKINKLVGSNTPTGKLLDIYYKLKDIPVEQQFNDVGHAYSFRDLYDVIFGNCNNLYASIDTVIKTFEEIQTKAEQKTDRASLKPAGIRRKVLLLVWGCILDLWEKFCRAFFDSQK